MKKSSLCKEPPLDCQKYSSMNGEGKGLLSVGPKFLELFETPGP